MEKILLFYKYVDIERPQEILKWQKKLCLELNLKGRIILAAEGINGTLGGSEESCNLYIEAMLKHPLFFDVDFKESSATEKCFEKLRIVIKEEVVNLRLDTKKFSVKDTGKHLTPKETHELLSNPDENLVILDGRNNYESAVGAFENAIKPDIKYFRQFPDYIDKNIDLFKDKNVLMYCTGGIRCERASTYLKLKNVAKEVYQIKGGIHRYIEQYPEGYFRGKNYVFDGRVTVKVNDDVLGNCFICGVECDEYQNCLNAKCNRHFISCKECVKRLGNTCSMECAELVSSGKVNLRPYFKKVEI